MWSIGCIFAEMVTGKALFTGLNDSDQVKKIFKILGTPDENVYPGIAKLENWKPEEFEKYEAKDLKQYVPTLEEEGYKLLVSMLQINPEKRITTDEALNHPYFDEIKETIVKEIYK